MIIQKIRIEGFKSIYQPLEIDFSQVKGFWKINGVVGSGKTTLGEAILYGLFGTIKGKNNNDLISWGLDKCIIDIHCVSKNKSLYIKRFINRKGQSLPYIEIDGEELKFTNKRDAQDILEKDYYDVSKTLLETLCILSFNNFKSLTSMTPYESKLFLDQIFGFSTLSQYSDICKQLRSNNKKDLNEKNKEIYGVDKQIEQLDRLINVASINETLTLDELKNSIDDTNKSIKNCKSEYQTLHLSLKSEYDILYDNLSNLKVVGSNKKKELKNIKNGVCPTCGGVIDKSYIIKVEEELKKLVNDYNSLEKLVNDKKKNIQHNKQVHDEEINKYNTLIKSLENRLFKLQEHLKLKSFNNEELNDLNNTRKELSKQLSVLEKNDIEWNQLQDILDITIKQQIIQSFIPLINSNINYYTQQLKQPYIIEFDNTFKCNISLQNGVSIGVSSLSTGQQKTIDMCIILGIMRVVTKNVNFNVIFLDELLSNLDDELRSIMCDVIYNNLDENQTLFIISHLDIPERCFNGEINVTSIYREELVKESLYKIRAIN